MSQQRSNGSSRVRSAGPTIFNCLPDDFMAAETRRLMFRELIGWTEVDGQGVYQPLAPILYKNYAGQHDRDTIFLNPILMKVSNPFFITLHVD